MYPVTIDFLDKMKADRRQVSARVEIDYTDPFIDQSIQIEANEQANISYPQQTADSVDQTTRKYACLDGTWDLMSGEYHLAPSADQFTQQQFGWWGAQFCDQDGYFASPYPTLTVRHLPRPIRQLKVVGDTARGEYPADFTVRLYGPDDTLLHTETVTDNDQVSWSKTLEPQVLDVAKQVLEITKWSLPGTCTKIIEFFTSIREVYETGDLVSLRLLEEREASQGSLPVGNISSNEITLALNNESKKFDIDNEQSPLKNLLKPNRRIQAWLGTEAENAAAENPPTFTRNSVAYLSDGTQVVANVPRFEQGKFGRGVMVEEGTTNLLRYSEDFAQSVWFKTRVDVSLAGMLLNYQVIRFTPNTPEMASAVSQSFLSDGAAERTFTWSFWARGQTNRQFRVNFYGGVSETFVHYAINLTTEWQKFSITHTFPSNATSARIQWGNVSPYWGISYTDWIEVAGVQVEEKPYSTSYMKTTSSTATRSPETLTIPTAGVLNLQEGTVEFWVYPFNTVKTLDYDRLLFGSAGTLPGVFWCNVKPNQQLRFVYDSNGVDVELTGGTVPNLSWSRITIRWNTSGVACFINGVLVASDPRPITAISGAVLGIGGSYTVRYHANILIDDLRISSRARTDEETATAYQSNKPLQRDEDTTYLLSCNGSLYPVEMCWVPLGTFWSLDWDSPDNTLEATVTARDRMELLRKGTYQTSQVLTNKSLYELAEIVLQDAGLTSDEYIIDTDLQSIIIPYAWFNPVSHREALRRIAEAGLAAAFQNRDGKIQIESFLVTGDEPVLGITEDDYFPPLRAPSRQDQVANEIIVDTQPLRPATTPEEVYRSNEPMTIPASTTKTITAFYNKTPVIEAVASLDSPPTGVSITDATYYGWGASIKIQNTNATDAQTTLVIQGKPLTVQNKERAIVRDETSITENGVLRFEFPANPLVQKLDQAQAIADALLASVKDPRRDIEVDWRGNPALLLGDRVTVKGKDYHVIRQEISWAGYMQAKLTGRKAE